MTPICASFSDFKLIKGRKVCQLVCEVPLEQADAALIALGGLPNPHAERWVGIVPLKAQPQGQDNSGSAPSPSLADAADSPAAAPEVGSAPGLASGWSPPQAPARGAAEPATKPKKHWDELKPSQQAGMACRDASFREWTQDVMASPEHRWDGAEYCDSFMSEEGTKDWPACYVRWYCGVTSRSDLDTNPEAAKRWRELHSMFTADTQYGDRR